MNGLLRANTLRRYVIFTYPFLGPYGGDISKKYFWKIKRSSES